MPENDIERVMSEASTLLDQGQLHDALRLYSDVCDQASENAEAWLMRGSICGEVGSVTDAVGYIKRAIEIAPEYEDAYMVLGQVLRHQGKNREALECYRKVAQLAPDDVETHAAIGVLLIERREFQEAIGSLEIAVRLESGNADAWFMLGWCQREAGNIRDAEQSFSRAIEINPAVADWHFNLGDIQRSMGDLRVGITSYQKAIELNPNLAAAINNMGLALQSLGETRAAIRAFESAIESDPELISAQVNLGISLDLEGRGEEAIAILERAVIQNPDNPDTHFALANVLRDRGRLQEAITAYKRTLQLKPDYAQAHSCLLMDLNYSTQHTPEEVFMKHVDFGKQYAEKLEVNTSTHVDRGNPDRKLRIGYVSPDFRSHSVAFYIEPVFENHNHKHFEIFSYYNQHSIDPVTERLRGRCDHWRQIAGMEDVDVAELIRKDKIDILVDLAGHTANNRLMVFARKPAPVQVTWLGYPNTTGLTAVDYRITDRFADPVGMTDDFHTEKLIRLPDTFSCYRPPQDAPEVEVLPASRNGYITFASFNHFVKINPSVLLLWVQVLKAVPDSRLVVKNRMLDEIPVRESVCDVFAGMGIPKERLTLLGRDASLTDHLQRYNEVDIALDTFPYNGATTTADSLWMGVPVIAMEGKTHAGRVAVSQLMNIGCSNLIASSEQEYVSIAATLVSDLYSLAQLRGSLRERMASSPIVDAVRFTRNLEVAYQEMWSKQKPLGTLATARD